MTRRKCKRKDPAAVVLRRTGAKVSSKWPLAQVFLGELLETTRKLPQRLRGCKGGCA